MKKILKPRTLALTYIITIAISILLNVFYRFIFINSFSYIKTYILAIIINFLLTSSFYIITYFLIFLIKKEVNMKKLNLFLLIGLIISTISYIIGDVITISTILNNSYYELGFITWFNMAIDITFIVLEIIMVYGLLREKTMPYKTFMIILISLAFSNLIPFIINIVSYVTSGNHTIFILLIDIFCSLLITIAGIISSCSFNLFLYIFGKKINENNLNTNNNTKKISN